MDEETKDRGFDPNSPTGTKDAVDPETGTYGTAGTPMTTGYGVSGSTIGTGSEEGEEEVQEGDYPGATPNTKDYSFGGKGGSAIGYQPLVAHRPSLDC